MPAYVDPFGDDSPGPYLTLRVSWGDTAREILALLDTGADVTQIPVFLVELLGLEQIGEMTITSAHDEDEDKPVFAVNLAFEGIDFPASSVVVDEFPIALIGRDLLNDLNSNFEGPARRFAVVRPY